MWFDFPLPNAIFFTLGFKWYFAYTIEAPEASEQAAKKVEGAALELPPGLTCPGPCKPKCMFSKNDLPANLFLLCVIPQKHKEFTPAF